MDIEYLSKLPSNTFGHHYYQFMSSNGLSAQRAQTKFVEDEELAYVMTRYRENHDFLHTLTGSFTRVVYVLIQHFIVPWMRNCLNFSSEVYFFKQSSKIR